MCAVFVSQRVRRYVEAAVSEATRREHAEREIAAASRVQTGVLPKQPPAVRGFAIAGWTRPAEQAGGDYYDWTELPDGEVVVSIADVAGHGLGPALITAFCRAYARSTIEGSSSLGDALTRINGLIARDLPTGRFVTFAAARLTPGASDVALLSAGHGPILHYHAASGAVTALGADDLPLGIDPDLSFGAAQTIEMGSGDALVLLTDGFFEWADPTGEAWGIERLEETVRRAADQGPDALIGAMVRDVEAFAGAAPQLDDLTVVVIARGGS
jgi:serine phosphatase RsbU (regulator of sigma subunit)